MKVKKKMYLIRNIKSLEELGFKKYQLGYSRKSNSLEYDFIDVEFKNFELKTGRFLENQFEYKYLSFNGLYNLIKSTLKLKDDKKIKKYINDNFERKEK